jgi:hypothetical protein
MLRYRRSGDLITRLELGDGALAPAKSCGSRAGLALCHHQRSCQWL